MITIKRRDEKPPAAEFGLLRAYLALSKTSQAQIKAVLGDAVQGRTRSEIVDTLKAWLKSL